ncbi:hypothetical protein BVC80_1327g9 [Macleaya cordata]|uniref:Uncharacterized protein n=1 Tax=Macleaya cordata TaxID=56857 RepID=A0A200PPG5_MACCD|nr:hypothetical protein BVC80_1327g9 [Macleaya cordata]
MDTESPCKEVSEELARESLIAISQSIPSQSVALKVSSEDFTSPNGVVVKDGDGADKYRSKLISISYTQSPDIVTLPVAVATVED